MNIESSKLGKIIEELSENVYRKRENINDQDSLGIVSAPIVRLLNSIIEQAVMKNSSDIHIEPTKNYIRIRFRINGELKKITKLSINNLSSIITRIKILAEMDISESRLAQDGRIETVINNEKIDMRISTLPTVYGEKVVIRLLNREQFNFTKKSLGLSKGNLKTLNEILKQPYGMVLVTGPTGSGKTTTLYTILKELNKIEKNIITIEDPVEYKLNGVNQIQVNHKSGLTFVNGLRSIFRQDPDIVMVGEIRDNDTAKLAIRTSITGHLLLSTLHTNDGPSTIIRLLDMGIEPYLLASSIIGIISQRLIKVLCNECKEVYEADDSEKHLLKSDLSKKLFLYRAKGCNKCDKGYTGRTAVFEVMPIKKNLRDLINCKEDLDIIRESALKDGMITLLDSAIELVKQGLTSYKEVTRIGRTFHWEELNDKYS